MVDFGRQHFEIKDWQGVELILATAAAHYIPGEMLWLRFIGPSRSGRTELLRAMAEYSDCAEMEVLTPAAFRGGFKGGKKILERINELRLGRNTFLVKLAQGE